MGGAVADGEERVQGAECFVSFLRFHVLRFIQNQDRARLLQELVGQAFAGQFFGGLEDNVGSFVEGVERDDQDLDEGGGGEGAQLAQAGPVVLDQVDGLVAVQGAEVVTGDLEVLDPTFVDGDAGDDDDELAEAEAAAKFVDGAQGGVGFARAGFHFGSKTGIAPGLATSPFGDEAFVHFETASQFGGKVVILPDLAQVVVEPGFVQTLKGWKIGDDLTAQTELCSSTREPFEKAHDTVNSVELVFLVGIELKL